MEKKGVDWLCKTHTNTTWTGLSTDTDVEFVSILTCCSVQMTAGYTAVVSPTSNETYNNSV